MEFNELLLDAYMKPDPNPFLFEVGQTVRVCDPRKRRSWHWDGQTPKYWYGASVKIIRRYCTGLFKEHWYELEHLNGVQDHFREEELDRRFRRKANDFQHI